MNQTPVDATNEKLFDEFNTVVTETEQLIRSVAGAGTEKAGALKASLEETLASAREQLAKIRRDALTQASAAARATEEYVQDRPWQSIGIVALVAGAAGLIAGLLIARR